MMGANLEASKNSLQQCFKLKPEVFYTYILGPLPECIKNKVSYNTLFKLRDAIDILQILSGTIP